LSLDIEFEAPSWDEIYDMLLALADMIRRDGFSPNVIVGVSRGGWPPARVMSDLLGNVELANVRVEFYRGVAETGSKPIITQPLSMPVKGKKVLIMDDVADTGKSLELVKKHVLEHKVSEVKIATIYYKPWSIIMPDYYIRVTRRCVTRRAARSIRMLFTASFNEALMEASISKLDMLNASIMPGIFSSVNSITL
jgi:hypoxanthine phosphoribosyltransferase